MSNVCIDMNLAIESINTLIKTLPYDNHFKIHKIYHANTVPPQWFIEEDRLNEDLHLLFVKSGHGSYFLNGIQEDLYRGKIIFVSNGFPHSAKPDLNDLPSIIPIRFGLYNNKTSKLTSLFEKPFCFSLVANDIPQFEKKFEQLYDYYLENNEFSLNQASNALLSQIIIDIYNCLIFKKPINFDERIESIKIYIDKASNHKILLDTILAKFAISKSHFIRLFKKYYGITPHKYIIILNISKADFMLEETNISIEKIALELGYPDQYTFSKQYKKVRGFPPSYLRNRTQS